MKELLRDPQTQTVRLQNTPQTTALHFRLSQMSKLESLYHYYNYTIKSLLFKISLFSFRHSIYKRCYISTFCLVCALCFFLVWHTDKMYVANALPFILPKIINKRTKKNRVEWALKKKRKMWNDQEEPGSEKTVFWWK